MDLMQGLLIITSIHLLAAASPGPDFILVSQQTLSNGKQSGFMVSIGIALGLSVHIIYSALGLAAVIANSATALWLIKLIGGCYLIYLGIQGLRAKPLGKTEDAKLKQAIAKHSNVKAIAKGFLCNALNPKAPIYFVALFTVVLSPDLPLLHLVIYGVWMMILQLLWFSAVVVLLSRPSVNEKFQRLGHWIDRVLGGAMILIGLKVLTSKIN
jgi:RhtB (resistance to homoserine/threonine) family protein|tara:strand:+ start:7264 stop:7899 length:636 start_codon:yes stop_codon:yes gene_type:complete